MEGSGLEQTVGTNGGDRPRLGEETVAANPASDASAPAVGGSSQIGRRRRCSS